MPGDDKRLREVLDGFSKFLRQKDLAPATSNHTWFDGYETFCSSHVPTAGTPSSRPSTFF